jgi:hypothetical protein
MITPPLHVSRGLAALALSLATVSGALGQLGSSSSELIARYGRPLLQSTNETGVQSLTYRKDGFDITAFGRDGVALRVIYQKKNLTDQDVELLLEVNRGEAHWTPWAPLGIPTSDDSVKWLRSDEMAMAVRKGNEFSVTAGAWNPPSNEEAVTTTPPPVEAASAIKTNGSAAAPPPPIRVRPASPAIVPTRGDTRARAIELLGRPLGGGVSGSKEILQYKWGQVYLEQGKVMKVD